MTRTGGSTRYSVSRVCTATKTGCGRGLTLRLRDILCSISSDLRCLIAQIKVLGVCLCVSVPRPTRGIGNTWSSPGLLVVESDA